MLALASQDLAEERAKKKPNAAHVNHLKNWQKHLNQVRSELDIKNHEAVKAATVTYGQLWRNQYEPLVLPLDLPIWVTRGPLEGM